MHLLESGEMYLETIYILLKDKAYVRSIDIAEYMRYKKPSVSRAVGILRNGGFINVDPNGHITLTEAGLEIASKIDACKIEHVISDETFDAIKKHITEKI